MAAHHPADDVLVALAAGGLDAPTALLVATHSVLCPGCREAVRSYEALGGVLLDALPPVPVGPDCLPRTLQRLEDDWCPDPAPALPPLAGLEAELPRPLRDHLTRHAPPRWRWVMPGVRAADLGLGPPPLRTQLVRVKAGTALPRHGHSGREAILVLAGGFADESGAFGPGDTCFSDETVTHRQVADAGEDCLCLLVTAGPVRPTNALLRAASRLRPF